jgi:hypothetical protein
MSTSWSLTASQICTDALEHLGAIADGETPSAGDLQTCLRGLDGLLKELPAFGYHWPSLSVETALTWTGAAFMALPADYYNFPTAWKLVNGEKYPLVQFPHAEWVLKHDRAASGDVTHFYISPDNKFYVWPVPAADPVVSLQYMRIVDDASIGIAPAVSQIWLNPLGYGVADEVGLKFGVSKERRTEIKARWLDKKSRALESSQGYETITIEVQE